MTGDTNNEQIAIYHSTNAQRAVDHAIAATPTGERRNLLTEANIHLLLAQEKLAEVEKLESIS